MKNSMRIEYAVKDWNAIKHKKDDNLKTYKAYKYVSASNLLAIEFV